MSRHTSLRVGGPADALVHPGSRADVVRIIEVCRDHGVPIHVLGRGFNTLVLDAGVRGVVVQLRELRELGSDESGRIHAEAGVTHSAISRLCVDQSLAGLEFAVGIPGTVGGWIRMNAGIPDREMKDVVESVEYVDLKTAVETTERARDLRWRYRALDLPGDACIVAARFATAPGEALAIRRDMDAQLARRRATQPIDRPSCGSVFKNPPGDHAGRLIDAAGLKGLRCGGAGISEMHANFIENVENATASDVLSLIERARQAVMETFGVELETEVQRMGGAE